MHNKVLELVLRRSIVECLLKGYFEMVCLCSSLVVIVLCVQFFPNFFYFTVNHSIHCVKCRLLILVLFLNSGENAPFYFDQKCFLDELKKNSPQKRGQHPRITNMH